MVCPACHDTGYEAVDVDEVAPCTHPDHGPVPYSRSCGSCGGGIEVNDYGFCKSCWLQMAARDMVEADGYRWSDRDSHPHYRGFES